MRNWQEMVGKWVLKTFGEESLLPRERNLRFIEEALELVQSHNITQDDINKVIDRVYQKPPGNPVQEMGGVMVTLLALADTHKYDTHECLVREWTRISKPTEEDAAKFQESQKSKLEAGL